MNLVENQKVHVVLGLDSGVDNQNGNVLKLSGLLLPLLLQVYGRDNHERGLTGLLLVQSFDSKDGSVRLTETCTGF